MDQYLPLINPVLTYAWGSYSAIAELLGERVPAEQPQAELWMGAHPKAPSAVDISGARKGLDELIHERPLEILGPVTATEFMNQLPFLFKVLAARQPLSIQAHPDAAQAMIGFRQEERLGIPLNAPERNYRDPHHKPECICALEEFWALCGFRTIDEIAHLLHTFCPAGLGDELALLTQTADGSALKRFFAKLLRLDAVQRSELLSEARKNAAELARNAGDDAPAVWIDRMAVDFPEDIGILGPAFMNLVRLEPGEALFLPAGRLHAYLSGTGLELMANSDNVLRGGLTSKHVDVDELLKVLDFKDWRPEVIQPEPLGRADFHYPCPVREFQLSGFKVTPGQPFQSPADRAVEILLCTSGQVQLGPIGAASDLMTLSRGSSVLIPASAPAYQISGTGLIYRAGVPIDNDR